VEYGQQTARIQHVSAQTNLNNLAVAGAIAALMSERSGTIETGEWYQLRLYFRIEKGGIVFERTDLRPVAPDAVTQIPASIPFDTPEPST
jgi:hypothetical protein